MIAAFSHGGQAYVLRVDDRARVEIVDQAGRRVAAGAASLGAFSDIRPAGLDPSFVRAAEAALRGAG